MQQCRFVESLCWNINISPFMIAMNLLTAAGYSCRLSGSCLYSLGGSGYEIRPPLPSSQGLFTYALAALQSGKNIPAVQILLRAPAAGTAVRLEADILPEWTAK